MLTLGGRSPTWKLFSFFALRKHPYAEADSHLPGEQAGSKSGCLLPVLIDSAIICTVATLAFIPILARGFPNGDDAFVHYRWLTQFHEAVQQGSPYPRWLPSANDGRGSPVMLYYPPLPFFISDAFSSLVEDPMKALTLNCWFALILSGLAMYVLGYSLLSNRAGLIAALIYVFAPYHLFDLYQRSALSEYWSFAFLPLALDAVCRIAKQGDWCSSLYLAISYALLILTHLPIAFAFTLVLLIYIAVTLRSLRRLLQAVAGVALGVGISAIFIFPVLFERGYVRIDRALRIRYMNYFLFESLSKSSNMPLFPSPDLHRFYIVEEASLIAVGLVLMLALGLMAIRSGWRSDEGLPLMGRPVLAIYAVTVLSLLMTTRLTSPIWRAIPQLPYMQFPFRWLVIVTAGACLIAAAAVSALKQASRLRVAYVAVISAVLIFNLAMSVLIVMRASYDQEAVRAGVSATEVPEYRTIWLEKWKHSDESVPDEFEHTPVIVESGDAIATVIENNGSKQSYVVTASQPSTLKLRTHYFPGWVARTDGKQLSIAPSREGNIQLTVEPGNHKLTLSFEDTWPRCAGKAISAVSLLIALAMAWLQSGSMRFRIR
jgi:uncharacterized membrane protein